MYKFFSISMVSLSFFIVSLPIYAAPALAPTGVTAASPAAVAPSDFAGQVLTTIQKFGGAPTMLKISLVVLLIVSSMKVTILNNLIWSKLGSAQAFAAPILGLLAGILDLAGSGGVSLASVLAYVSAGAGAIILHELLDATKGIPGLGPLYVAIINAVEKGLGGPAATAAPEKAA